MRVQIEPKLQHIEEQLSLSFRCPIDKVLNLEQIYGCIDRTNFKDLMKELQPDFDLFSKEYKTFLRWNIYPIYSLLILINQFDFYLFEKDYLSELIYIFKNSNQIKFIGEERQNIVKDRNFIQNKIPDDIQIGMFSIDLIDIKQLLIKKMTQSIETIDKELNSKLEQLLSEVYERKEYILSQLKQEPVTIEKYITLMNAITDKKMKDSFKKCEYEVRQAHLTFQVIEENFVSYDEFQFRNLMEAQKWINSLIEAQKSSQHKLEKNRNIFHKDFEIRKQELIEEFKDILSKQRTVIQNPELDKYEQNLRNCKTVEDSYKILLNKGFQINNQERQLGYELSDFSEFEKAYNDFSRYVQFWEFTEKWFRLSDNWNALHFEEIFKNEMSQEIKYEIITTCREGCSLLEKLRQLYIIEVVTPRTDRAQGKNQFDFGDTQFLQLIAQVDESIKKFQEYVHISVLLMDKQFTQEYQDQLLKHLNLKIKYEKLSINKLREHNVHVHTQLIYQLYNKAKQENELKDDILKIQNVIIKEIVPICGLTKIPDFPTHYIQNGKNIIRKLNDITFCCNKIIRESHLQKSKVEPSYDFVKYIQCLIQSFQDLLQTQEIMVKVCSFFGSAFEFISPPTSIIKQYEAFKEEYKQDC